MTSLAPIAHAGGPAVCNAKHKRAANLYGSVLSDGLKPALAFAAPASPQARLAAPVSPSMAPAPTAASVSASKPTQVSRAEMAASFAPCGAGRA